MGLKPAKLKIQGQDQSKKAFDSVKKNLGNMESLAKKLGGVLVGVFAVAKIKSFAEETLTAADNIGKFADRAGISTVALQEMKFAFDQAGVGQEAVNQAMVTFGKRLGKARQGVGALVGGLKGGKEGLLEMVKATGSTEEAIQLMFQAMGEARNQAEKLAIADAAFGQAGLRMTAAFNDGTTSFEAARKKAHDLGIVLDEDLVRGAENANDRMNELSKAFGAVFQKTILELAPTLASLATFLTDALPAAVRFSVQAMFQLKKAFLLAIAGSSIILQEFYGVMGKFPGIVGENFQLAQRQVADFRSILLKGLAEEEVALFSVSKHFGKVAEAASFAKKDIGLFNKALTPEKIIESQAAVEKFAGGAIFTSEALQKTKVKMVEISDTAKALVPVADESFLIMSDAAESAGFAISRSIGDSLLGLGQGFVDFGTIAKQILSQVVAELIQVFVIKKLVGFATGGASEGLGALGSLFGFASGGSVAGGKPVVVGENGPEIFTPQAAGQITPNNQLAPAGATEINFNISTVDATGFNQLLQSQKGRIVSMIAEAMNRKGKRFI